MSAIGALFTLLLTLLPAQAASTSDFIRWDLKESATATPEQYGMLHVPTGYSGTQSYPLIVFLHGSGDNAIPIEHLDWQITSGNIDQLLVKAKANNAFLLAPQATENQWNPTNVQKAMLLAAAAVRSYNIDPNRIYLTGLSMGGGGTWLTLRFHNGIVAASVPVCGVKTAGTLTNDGLNNIDPNFAVRLVGKKIWTFHAKDDPTVSVGDAQAYVSAILTAGGVTPPTFPVTSYTNGKYDYASPGGELKYREYQTGGHGIWGTVYSTAEVYPWLFGNVNSGLDLQPGERLLFHFGNYAPPNDAGTPFWNTSLYQAHKLPNATIAFARTDANRQTRVSVFTTGTFGTSSMGNDLPSDAWLYGNTGGNGGWGTTENGTGVTVINGLVPGETYTVQAFAAINYSAVSNITQYTIGSQAKNLKVLANNSGSTAIFSATATANGEITISTAGVDLGWNSKTTGYLNTLSIVRTTDAEKPVVTITNPIGSGTYTTSDPTVILAGTGTDNVGVTKVEWKNKAGGSGTASGITNWAAGPITLYTGTNLITISAYDAAQNRGFATLTVVYSGSATTTNQPPTVSSGTNQTTQLPNATVTLNGSVRNDDGLPVGGTLTKTWSKLSGPGAVTFGNVNSEVTTASFTVSGTYVLRLTGNDGALTATSDVTITVNPPPPVNTAPTVSAGSDLTTVWPNATVSLTGVVSDPDMLPSGTTTALWSKSSGPGTVTFGNVNSATTTATFSTTGAYVLQLVGSDTVLTGTSTVNVTVSGSAVSSGTTGILTPNAWGVFTTTTNYMENWNRAFNAQPTWDVTNLTPVGGDTSGTNNGYIKVGWDAWRCVAWIDFGPDWANKRIQQTWTKYIVGRPGSPDPYNKVWWDNDQSNLLENAAGNIAETTLNFDTQAHVGGEWKKDRDVWNNPIAPKGRYLKVKMGDNRSADPNEYAFVGYTITTPPPPPPTGVIPVAGCNTVLPNYAKFAYRSFTAQPTWDAVNNCPVGGDTGDTNTGYIKATWDVYDSKSYIDFGPDWQKVRIQQTWTKYIVGRAGTPDPYRLIYWDDDNDDINDTGVGNAIAEPTINFDTKNHVGGDWVQDVDVTSAPITPKGRYLIMTEGTRRSADANELVIIGYIVP